MHWWWGYVLGRSRLIIYTNISSSEVRHHDECNRDVKLTNNICNTQGMHISYFTIDLFLQKKKNKMKYNP